MLRTILTAGGLLGLFLAPVWGSSFPSSPLYPSFNSPHRDANLTTFDAPGSTDTEARGINASGVIVGDDGIGKYFYGFVRSAKGTFTKFNPKGGKQDVPVTINDSGAITGFYFDSHGTIHGFVRAPDGTIASFDAPGAVTTRPTAMNANGVIVGFYYDNASISHGFLRDASGNITTVDVAGETGGTLIWGINNKGVIAGECINAKGAYRGFVRGIGGKFTIFDVPGASKKGPFGTDVLGINKGGVTFGNFYGSSSRGFVRAVHGKVTEFDPPDSTATYPQAMNGAGAIAGYYENSGSTRDGFVRAANGTIMTFDAPGATGGTIPAAINSKSVIVGTYYDADGGSHAFVRTP
ncbi:MAG TPA: hypothetical protein VGG36_11055 [Rhizomicrobium sp.]|jgi:hypothetical protein